MIQYVLRTSTGPKIDSDLLYDQPCSICRPFWDKRAKRFFFDPQIILNITRSKVPIYELLVTHHYYRIPNCSPFRSVIKKKCRDICFSFFFLPQANFCVDCASKHLRTVWVKKTHTCRKIAPIRNSHFLENSRSTEWPWTLRYQRYRILWHSIFAHEFENLVVKFQTEIAQT